MARKVEVLTDYTHDDIVYLAGYIDGDGCFYCGQVKQGRYGSGYQFSIKLIVTSCDKLPIDWMRNTFGGNNETQLRPAKNRPFDRVVYQWVATGELLDEILHKLEPHLKNKKRQCQIMLELRKTFKNIGSERLPQEIIVERLKLITQMRSINTRFHNHPLKQQSLPLVTVRS